MPDTLARLPPSRTARLDLRRLGPQDAAALAAMTDDPAITRVVHILPTPFTEADARTLLLGHQDGRDQFLGAWTRDPATLAAAIGTHLHGEHDIEIGYWVRTDLHGQGLATEALAAILATLRAELPHRRITAECRQANRPSWHLLEKLGFLPDGTAGHRPERRRLVLG